MPRSVSGNYTLPLPPVVSNTIIQAAWANTTQDDLAQAVTDSLDRYGRGGMVAPFRLVDGIVTAPGFAFVAETGTGLWRDGDGVMAVSVQGAKVAQWSSTGFLAGDIGTENLTATNILASVIDADTVSASVGINAPVLTTPLAEFGALHVTGISQFEGNTVFNGDVGIDCTPSYKLHLYGGSLAVEAPYAPGATPGDLYLSLFTRNSTTAFVAGAQIRAIWNRISDTDFGSTLAFNTANDNNPIERMRIDNDGNIGIGQPAASGVRLHVRSVLGGDSARFTDAVTYTIGIKALAAGLGMIYGTTGSALSFGANDIEWMRIAQTGEVGMGRAPSAGVKLDVQGFIRSINDGMGLRLINAAGDGGATIGVPFGPSAGLSLSGDGGPVSIFAGGVERMRLFSAGNVGIYGPSGTAPGALITASGLEVKGNANTVVLHGPAPTGYVGLRLYNDTYNSARSLEINYMGSAYGSAALGWGPAGEAGAIATTNSLPLLLGAANTARLWIQHDGGQPIRASSNANWHALTLDPGPTTAAIPIGAVIAGEGGGFPAGGVGPCSEVTLGGGAQIVMNAYPPAGNVTLTTGTYRVLSRVNSNYAVFIKTAG